MAGYWWGGAARLGDDGMNGESKEEIGSLPNALFREESLLIAVCQRRWVVDGLL